MKQRPGGQVDVEFACQALQLLHPGAADPTTRVALDRLAAAGALAPDRAALLVSADRVWRTIQGMLRIAAGPVPPASLPPATAAALLRATAAAGIAAVDIVALSATLDALAERVRAAASAIIGEPLRT